MLVLGTGLAVNGVAGAAAQVTCLITGKDGGGYGVLYEGQFAAAAALLFTTDSETLISSIFIVNNDAVARSFGLYVAGTTAATKISGFSIPAGGSAQYGPGGWACLDSSGVLQTVGGSGGGVTDGDKGDVTVSSSGAVWTVDNNTITLAKLQDIATSSILGRVTAATGDPEVLTIAQVMGLNPAIDVQVLTGSGNWTKPAGARIVVVEGVGGGGGSGGCASTAAGSRAGSGGGGGSGYVKKTLMASVLGSTEPYAVGAAGTAGAAGNNNGGAGGNTTFGAGSPSWGTQVKATGGGGGEGSPAETTATTHPGGTGGVGTGGEVNASGQPGDSARIMAGPVTLPITNGGNSLWGGGGLVGAGAAGSAPPGGFGGGGGGSTANASDTSKAGAAGTPGTLVVTTWA